MEPQSSEAISPLGCLAALAVGPLVAFGTAALFSRLTDRSMALDEELGVLVFQSILVAVPFIAVAITGTKRAAPWLVALSMTLAFWGYYLFSGVSYQWNPDGTGVDFGLAFFMLLSPVIITASAIGVYVWRRTKGR